MANLFLFGFFAFSFFSITTLLQLGVYNNYQFTEVEVASRKIYRAAKHRGNYPPLATDTELNNCFSIY